MKKLAKLFFGLFRIHAQYDYAYNQKYND